MCVLLCVLLPPVCIIDACKGKGEATEADMVCGGDSGGGGGGKWEIGGRKGGDSAKSRDLCQMR